VLSSVELVKLVVYLGLFAYSSHRKLDGVIALNQVLLPK
jgi:hypothetical protein